jgi:hypothetical protein
MAQEPLTTSKVQRFNARAEAELCGRCQNIDFHALFDRKEEISRENGLFVLRLDKLVYDPVCPACHLFYGVALPHDRLTSGVYHIRSFLVGDAIGLTVVHGADKRRISLRTKIDCFKRGFLIASTEVPLKKARQMATSAAVDASKVNYDHCKAWLQHCEGSHRQRCRVESVPRRSDLPLVCIDCITQEIHPISPEEDYCALSYVWGATKKVASQEQGRVPKNIEQVIRDAMEAVKQLGKRYLWVDRYCVEQQDHRIKAAQIGAMDQIYFGAYVTIIAAAGSDPNYGLPGISRPRLYRQPSLSVAGLELLSSLLGLPAVIEHTIWHTRAWTYQESVLPRRCIYFTEYQTYFVCCQMIGSEAVVVRHVVWPGEDGVKSPPETLDLSMLQVQERTRDIAAFCHLTTHIGGYSGKVLTKEEDKLNAFRGLLSRSRVYSFYGIPMATTFTEAAKRPNPTESNTDFDTAFAIGLFWAPAQKSLRRIPQFPSWTWAGWNGSVVYRPSEREFIEVIQDIVKSWEVSEVASTPCFWLQDTESGNLATLQEVATSLTDSKVIPELSYSLVIDAIVLQLRIRQISTGNYFAYVFKHQRFKTGKGGKSVLERDWGIAVFLGEPPTSPKLDKKWDAILLFGNTSGSFSMLIIEYEDDVACRVGQVTSKDNSNLEDVECHRRRIRMI